jgi:small subunit ribosomal protein S16
MIRIRLRRVGKKHHPYYRLVVADQPAKRDGAFLETLGSYDPHANPPTVTLDEARAREWLGKGAQPSEAAGKILRRAGVIGAPAVAVVEPEVTPAKKPRAARAKKAAE